MKKGLVLFQALALVLFALIAIESIAWQSENQAASLFKLDPAQLEFVKNSGVSFYTPPEDPIIVAPPPAAKISAPTSGRVLEDTDEAPIEQQIASAPIQHSYSEVDKNV